MCLLYEVMLHLVEDLAHELSLDYGLIDGAEQFWECYAGENTPLLILD
jgi:hypothetical protein